MSLVEFLSDFSSALNSKPPTEATTIGREEKGMVGWGKIETNQSIALYVNRPWIAHLGIKDVARLKSEEAINI